MKNVFSDSSICGQVFVFHPESEALPLLCHPPCRSRCNGLFLHSAWNWLLFLLPQVGLDRNEIASEASTMGSFRCCYISLYLSGFPWYKSGCIAGKANNAFQCESSHLAELWRSVLRGLAPLESLLHCFETAPRPTKWKFPHHFQPGQRHLQSILDLA